jgi:hypothetical protein
MPSSEANGKETTIAFILAVIFGLGSLFYSFATAGDLFSVPAIALALAAVHYIAVLYVFIRTDKHARWLLLFLSVPLAFVSLDNLGWLLGELGGPSLRLFG